MSIIRMIKPKASLVFGQTTYLEEGKTQSVTAFLNSDVISVDLGEAMEIAHISEQQKRIILADIEQQMGLKQSGGMSFDNQ